MVMAMGNGNWGMEEAVRLNVGLFHLPAALCCLPAAISNRNETFYPNDGLGK